MGKFFFSIIWLFVEGLGVPLLSEGAFAPLGAAVHKGQVSTFVAYIGAWLAMSAGNTLGFYLFWHYGPALTDWLARRWGAFREKRAQVEPRVRRDVYFAITFARFIGLGTFQIVLWLAGVARVRWQYFLPLLYALNFVWTGLWLFGSRWLVAEVLPYLEGKSWKELLLVGLVVLGLTFVGHRVMHWIQRRFRMGRAGE